MDFFLTILLKATTDYLHMIAAFTIFIFLLSLNYLFKKNRIKGISENARQFIDCIRQPVFCIFSIAYSFILCNLLFAGFLSSKSLHSILLVLDILLIFSIAWLFLRLTSFLHINYIRKHESISANFDILGAIAKIAISVFTIIAVLDKLGINVGGLLALGGIGGVAIGFAGKDLFANFFGFLIIAFDRPFKIGDLISSADRQIRGVVEDISWRVTKVRSLEKRAIYIPNSLFATIVLQNETQMLARRISENLKFSYKERQAVDVFLKSINSFLTECKDLNSKFPHTFNLIKIGNQIAEIRLICFTKEKGWNSFMQIKQTILLRIEEVATELELREIHPDTSFTSYKD